MARRGSPCSAITCSRSPSNSRRTTRPMRSWHRPMCCIRLIARAMNTIGRAGMWDEEDGFYYDVLRLPNGSATRLKVRSMVGLLPLCATTAIEKWQRERVPTLAGGVQDLYRRMPEIRESIHATGPGQFGIAERGIMGLVKRDPAAPDLDPHARRKRVPQPLRNPGIVALPCRPSLCVFSWGRNIGSAICRRSPTVACLAATRTGAGRSGCRSTR